MRQTTLYTNTNPRRAPADGLAGRVCLFGSVGAVAANARVDVAAVQAALNSVPAAFAGPATPLALDGLVGPLTRGAIAAFQQGWLDSIHDGRIDPGGPTLGCLNAAAGAPSARVPGDLPEHATGPAARAWGGLGAAVVGATGLAALRVAAPGRVQQSAREPEILAIIRAMLRLDDLRDNVLLGVENIMKLAVRMAERAFDYARALANPGLRLPGFNSREAPGRVAFLLLAKHFHLSETEPDRALAAATRVLEVARRIRLRTVSRRGAFGVLFDQSDRYVATFRLLPAVPDAAAYNAVLGGADVPPRPSGQRIPAFPPNAAIERTDRIYLTPVWDRLTNLTKQAVLIHELIHFTGGVAPGIEDHAYASQPHYRTLSPALRLRNTDCHALYFVEPSFGSAKAAESLGIGLVEMGALPFIDPTGAISLPSSPTADDPFAFPCGFPIRARRR